MMKIPQGRRFTYAVVIIAAAALLSFVVTLATKAVTDAVGVGVSSVAQPDEERRDFAVTVKASVVGSGSASECQLLDGEEKLIPLKELSSKAFENLDAAVKAIGGPEAIMANPTLIPIARVHGEANTPWHCVAGAMMAVGISGYPKLEMSLVDGGSSNAMFTYEPPIPIPVPSPPIPVTVHTVSLKNGGVVLWDAEVVSRGALREKISERNRVVPKSEIHFDAQSNVNYGDVARLLSDLSNMGVVLQSPEFKIATEEYAF